MGERGHLLEPAIKKKKRLWQAWEKIFLPLISRCMEETFVGIVLLEIEKSQFETPTVPLDRTLGPYPGYIKGTLSSQLKRSCSAE